MNSCLRNGVALDGWNRGAFGIASIALVSICVAVTLFSQPSPAFGGSDDDQAETPASFAALKTHAKSVGTGGSLLEEQNLRGVVARWADGQTISKLPSDQLAWLLGELRPVVQPDLGTDFQTVWSGTLQVPRNGEYRFSVPPVDPNYTNGDDFVRQEVQVVVDGNEILNAQGTDTQVATDWQWRSEPVSLVARQSVSLSVRVRSAWTQESKKRAHASVSMLFWEGPGLSRTVIPKNALQSSDRQAGLDVKYQWIVKKKLQSASGIDQNIESAGLNAHLVAHENHLLRQRLADEILRRDGARIRKNKAAKQQLFFSNQQDLEIFQFALEAATCKQRSQWIQRAIVADAVLSQTELKDFLPVYDLLRVGVEDDALELLMAWSKQHVNNVIPLNDQGVLDRGSYRKMAIDLLASSQQGAIEKLQAEALEDDNGNCVLPIAYLCAYGHWSQGAQQQRVQQGPAHEWLEELDGALADDELKGDSRVNWLIARAFTEEARSGALGRFFSGVENFMAGFQWLDEAMLVVESKETKQRIVHERVNRLASGRQWERANLELKGFPDLADQGLRDQIQQLRKLSAAAIARQKRNSEAAVLVELARRTELRGDSSEPVAPSNKTVMEILEEQAASQAAQE